MNFLFLTATMRVYRDFFSYENGIYQHTAASRSEPKGFHSVRLVGWGVDNSIYPPRKYWVSKFYIMVFLVMVS